MPAPAILGALASGKGATPPVPTLAYTGERQFTISDYDSTLTYTLSGCTRVGNVITVTTTGVTATVTAQYPRGLLESAARSMLTAAHARVLDSVQQTFSSAGCGPRSNSCCSSTWIMDVNGTTCGGAPGTQGSWTECGGSCPGNCYGYFNVQCWSWHWTDYSASGYTKQGNVWGKAT